MPALRPGVVGAEGDPPVLGSASAAATRPPSPSCSYGRPAPRACLTCTRRRGCLRRSGERGTPWLEVGIDSAGGGEGRSGREERRGDVLAGFVRLNGLRA